MQKIWIILRTWPWTAQSLSLDLLLNMYTENNEKKCCNEKLVTHLIQTNKADLQSKVFENVNGLNYYFSWEVKQTYNFIWLSHTWTTLTVWNRGMFSGLGIKMSAGSPLTVLHKGQLRYGGNFTGVVNRSSTWGLNELWLCSMETSYWKINVKKKWFISAIALEHMTGAKTKQQQK